jgi:phage baseplate assembly protein V
MKDEISRMVRRLLSTFLRGRVNTTDDSGTVQLVQIKLNDLETVDAIPRLMQFGFTSHLPRGSDTLALFIGGDRSNSAVLASNHAASRPTGLAEGETAVFNQVGIKIYLSAGGLVIEGAGLPITVNNAPVVTINASTKVKMNTADLDVSGNITAGGDITDNAGGAGKSMASMRQSHNSHKHPVASVQTGFDTVTSGQPNPQV